MRRSIGLGWLVIVATLLACIGLSACGSSSGGAENEPTTASSTTAFAKGDSVAAKWTDGNLYLASVTAVEGDQIRVTYVDDGTTGSVATADVRSIPTSALAVGDRVLAVYEGGRLYPGEITEATGTTYTVKWDDGSAPSSVEAGKIIAE